MGVLQLEPRRAAFVYPIEPAPPTAVLVPVFRTSDTAPVFLDGWGDAARGFAPAAIAASKGQLARLASLDDKPHLTHAVIRIARPGERWLSETERDLLWDAFQVPIFEQVVDTMGHVLAQDCEAHDGLHIASMVFSKHLTARGHYIENELCGCGRKSLRLKQSPQEERFGRAVYRQRIRLTELANASA